MKNDIEWLEETNRLKAQRDHAILLAKRLYELSYCGCAVTACTCGLADTKREVEKLEIETCEYPLHWGGYDKDITPANDGDVLKNNSKLKNLFNINSNLAEAKAPDFTKINEKLRNLYGIEDN